MFSTFQQVKVSSAKQPLASAVNPDRPFLPPTRPANQADTSQTPVVERPVPTSSAASASTHQELDFDGDMDLQLTEHF